MVATSLCHDIPDLHPTRPKAFGFHQSSFAIFDNKMPLHQSVSFLRDAKLSGYSLRFHPRGKIGRRPDGRIVHFVISPRISDRHFSRADANADLVRLKFQHLSWQVKIFESCKQIKPGLHSAPGMITAVKNGHEAIATIPTDGRVMALQNLGKMRHHLVKARHDHLRIGVTAISRRAFEIKKHDGRGLAYATEERGRGRSRKTPAHAAVYMAPVGRFIYGLQLHVNLFDQPRMTRLLRQFKRGLNFGDEQSRGQSLLPERTGDFEL